MKRWMLSQYYRDSDHDMLVPVASAYGHSWRCPRLPDTDEGYALTEVLCEPQQIQAAKEDPRVIVCPVLMSPLPLDSRIIDLYATKGATPDMNLATLLSVLAEDEPMYEVEWEPDKF